MTLKPRLGWVKVIESYTTECLACHFLLVINCTRGCILYRLRDIAFDRSKIALFCYTSLAFNAPTDRFPWDDLREILHGGQRWPGYTVVKKYCQSFNSLSRVHERYRQTTDGFAVANT